MSDQQPEPVAAPEPIPVFPPAWFVENFNAGVARDWAGEGPAPYRTALDPLVMYSWHLATESLRKPQPLISICVIGGV